MHWESEIHSWWVYKWNIHVDCNDRHSLDSDRSSFNIETENITSNLNLNNSIKMDLYCISFKKYMDCMKSIEEAFYEHF